MYDCIAATSNGMDFNQLKQLAEKLGGILVMDGDKPKFVIISYDQYKKGEARDLVVEPETYQELPEKSDEDQKNYDRLNQEILALREEIKRKESAEMIDNVEAEEGVPADLVDFE
jgi:hypothetical protein